MPDPSSSADALLGILREWLTPASGKRPTIATNHGGQLEIPEVASPYPFKNPITPTKELDAAMRNIRAVVPGAGTSIREISTRPNEGLLRAGLRDIPGYATGDPDSINRTNVAGATPFAGPDLGRIYVNPTYGGQEYTLAHELTHAAGGDEASAQAIADKYAKYQRQQQPAAGQSPADFLRLLQDRFIHTRR